MTLLSNAGGTYQRVLITLCVKSPPPAIYVISTLCTSYITVRHNKRSCNYCSDTTVVLAKTVTSPACRDATVMGSDCRLSPLLSLWNLKAAWYLVSKGRTSFP
jgi:hypothetical protein